MRVLFLITILLVGQIVTYVPLQNNHTPLFDGENAYTYLSDQCDFGTRPPGSDNLSMCRNYIRDILETHGWTVTFQNFTYLAVECSNLIATWQSNDRSSIILGAHYDTRPLADQDPAPLNRTKPVMGANDAASGVAVLLELARVLPESVRGEVEFVFFDAEDSGGINGWSWIVGSTEYVDQLSPTRVGTIDAMILLDMVGDSELVLQREISSTQSLQDSVWNHAAELGHGDVFVDVSGRSILDDHRPFLDAGIPALDIIQHNPFPWTWHTVEDTPDKCSAVSLEIVGEVVEVFIVEQIGAGGTFTSDPPSFTLVIMIALPVIAILTILYYRRK